MKKDPFQYIFRFCCDPGFNDAEEIPALLRYVDEADIDDVAVFANVEEINTGHMSFDEQDVYLAMMRKISALLAEKGVTMSVNQWHSVMHADLGKTLRPEQNFRPMVDVEGNEAKLCVCPLCGEWQKYIARLYARYAELEPSILWVEDDFRLHNHEPLAWGGCFCDEHMKLYSARAGKPLTREEFLAGVLRPGEPHPYRKIWLDVSRETMLSAALRPDARLWTVCICPDIRKIPRRTICTDSIWCLCSPVQCSHRRPRYTRSWKTFRSHCFRNPAGSRVSSC